MEQTGTHREVRPIQAVTGIFDNEMLLIERTKQSLSFSRVASANNTSRFVRPADLDEFLKSFKNRQL